MTAKSVARPASYNQTLLIPSRPIIQYFALRLLPAVVRGCFLNSAQRLGDLLPNRGGEEGGTTMKPFKYFSATAVLSLEIGPGRRISSLTSSDLGSELYFVSYNSVAMFNRQ